MKPPLLDTHAWIWWVQGDRRLRPQELKALDGLSGDRRPLISSISLWEVATLVTLGRIRLETTFAAWLDRAADSRTVEILPITAAVAAEVAALPPTFHHDPADRVIVATSRVWAVPLLSHDRAIRASGLVESWSPRRG